MLLRFRPRRILLAATLGYLLSIPFLLGLAVPAAARCPARARRCLAGIGNETFGVLWDTAMQQEIPAGEALPRLLLRRARLVRAHPARARGAGPIADVIGTRETLIGAAAISLVATLAVLLVRDVRTLPRRVVPIHEPA